MEKECKHPSLGRENLRRRGIGWRMACFVLLLFMAPCAMAQQGQTFTVSFKANTLEEVFDYLSKNSDYVFTYNSADLRQEAKRVTHDFKNATLAAILDECLKGTAFTYEIIDRHVVVKKREEKSESVTVKGIVYDEKRQPLPGVTVQVVGTSVGTATTSKGWFSIDLPLQKGKLKFSFVGYKDKEVEFTEKSDTLRIYMEENVEELDEAIVVAYGETTRRKATGSISVVKADEIKGIPSGNIANLLQGRVAGMDITNLSGAPGGGDVAITIRGYNSLDVEAGRRFSNPLWVVDGVPLNSFTSPVTGTNLLSDLNPDMIESIQILKDASAASIYGSRAANGVIIVTTKKGRKNQDATFSVNVSQSWSVLPRHPDLTTGRAERLLRLKNTENKYMAYIDEETNSYKYPQSLAEQYEHPESSYNGFWYPDKNQINTDNGTMYQDSLNTFYNNSTNFETGKITNANIQTYGGSEWMIYGIGLGYYKETGIFKGTGFKRFDLNSNMTVTPLPRLNVDLRFNASLVQKKRASSSMDQNLQYSNEIVSVETISGDPYQLSSLLPGENSVVWNEVLKVYEGTREANRSVRLRSNFRLGYEIIEGLNFSTLLAADYAIARRNYFSPSYLSEDGNSMSLGETGINLMVLNENLLTYKRTFGESHSLELLGGFSYQYDQEEYNGGYAQKSPSDKIYYAPQGMPDLETVDWGDYEEVRALKNYQSDMQEKSLLSWFARLEYGYRDKYLLSLSIRRDGSSTFGAKNRWGTFPSVAAAWTFSEEPWVKENLGWLSFGKFRVSWGRSGMHFSQNYLALGIMNVGTSSYLGDSYVEPVWYDGLYNDLLSWEETDQYDFGIDLDFFNHRLSVTMDYYYRYTDKLLDRVNLPSNGLNTGYTTQWQNAAAISNEGLEVMVKYEIFRKPELYWKVAVNGAHNWNRFEKSYTGKDLNNRIIGKSLNGIYALRTNGFVDEEEEIPIYYNQQGTKISLAAEWMEYFFYKPGDYYFVDVNGDRKINFNDQVYCGSALPELTGGLVSEFSWRNFDVNLSISFQLGRHMLNYVPTRSLSVWGASEFPTIVMDLREITFWEQPGDNSDFPKWQYDFNTYLWGGLYTSHQVEKVNWLKMKTLSVGYTLPGSWIKRCGLDELRFFASGENLFTWTNYSGLDPEVVDVRTGIDAGSAYPMARKWTLGLTLKF